MPFGSVEGDLALVLGKHGAAAGEHGRLPEPVAGDVPDVGDAVDVGAERLDLLGELDHFLPGLGGIGGISAGLLHQVDIEVHDRQGDGEGQCVDLPVHGADIVHRGVEALGLQFLVGLDELVQRLGEITIDEDANAVEALEGDVRHLLGDGLAQHLLRGFLVGIVGGAERHLDVRIGLGELRSDLLVRAVEKLRVGVLHHHLGLLREGRQGE